MRTIEDVEWARSDVRIPFSTTIDSHPQVCMGPRSLPVRDELSMGPIARSTIELGSTEWAPRWENKNRASCRKEDERIEDVSQDVLGVV
jgi:hypothetical protein